MDVKQDAFNPAPREEESEISLVDILHVVKINWYWFVLSVALCFGVAVIYLLRTPKVYTRTASVLIKDDSKGGTISESAAFEDLGMFNVKRNVDNEILVFQSEQLMAQAARRLHLDINYTVHQGLRTTDLYTHAPVTLQFFDTEEAQEFSMVVTPLSEEEVLLSDFSDYAESFTARLKDTIDTPFGQALVLPTLYYSDEWYDAQVRITKNNMKTVIQEYREALQVALANKMTTIINLTLKDVSIQRTEDVINTLIAVYNEAAINDKNLITVNTSNFISERLVIIEQDLGDVDADIESFKRANQLTDIQSETGMYLRESSQYSQDELSLENQRELAIYIRNYLNNPANNAALIPANTGISDANIEVQINEYNTSLLKRDRLISNSSSNNPVVMDLNNSLNAMKQTIIRAVDNLIVGLDMKIRNVQARDKQNIRRITEVPTQQRYVLSVERQQKIKEELYLYLLNKREENALSQAITESNARIIDPASGSDMPVAPRTSIILLAAFVLGIVLPSGVFWGKEVLNPAIRNRKDVEDALTVPFLGEIPSREKKRKKKGESDSEVVVQVNGRDPVSEAFRIIRTNMEFMRVKAENMQVVMFTSAQPNSGKTFSSLNLAASLTLTDKKVLIIDLDIRKGTLSSLVKKNSETPGMTQYLSGKVTDIAEMINHSEVMENLDVIHAGPVPPNPAELLLSPRLDTLVKAVREEYDYIFIDSVPSGILADAAITNRVVDLTIYVVRAGLTDRRQLPEVEKLYRQEKFKNMSVLLNAVNYSSAGYYYYGYGYGYY